MKIDDLRAFILSEESKNKIDVEVAKEIIRVLDQLSHPLGAVVSQENGVRCLPTQKLRVESGKIKFGDDWIGRFFRGDDSIWYGALLKNKLEGKLNPIYEENLRHLAEMLWDVK